MRLLAAALDAMRASNAALDAARDAIKALA